MSTLDAKAILNRLRIIAGAESDNELASKIDVAQQTVASWRSRNSIPLPEILRLAERYSVSLDWLVLGSGPRDASEEAIDKELLRLVAVYLYLQHQLHPIHADKFGQYFVGVFEEYSRNGADRASLIKILKQHIDILKESVVSKADHEPAGPNTVS